MMTKCPKCGFTQPKDKFCANCGVDIELFEPQKSPLYKQIFRSTGLQLLFLFALIAIMTSIIYSPDNQIKPSQSKLTSRPSATLPPPVAKSKPSLKASQALKKEKKSKTKDQTSPQPVNTVSKVIKPQPPFKEVIKVAAVQPPPPIPPKVNTIHVRFAEVPQAVLNDVVFKNSVLGEDNHLRAGAYPLGKRLSKITQMIPGLSLLPGTRSNKLPMPNDESMNFQFLHAEEGQEYGLQFRLYIQLNSGELNIELEGMVNLKSMSGDNIYNASLQASYTLPQDQVLIIEVAIPPMPMDENHISSLSGTPLSIMSRTDFLDGQTSLVILAQTR